MRAMASSMQTGEVCSLKAGRRASSPRIHKGEVATTMLLHVARRFHYKVDTPRGGDVTGHRTETRTVPQPYESNYLSGTAVAIRSGGYPWTPRTVLPARTVVSAASSPNARAS